MSREIELEGGAKYSFPDDAKDEEILDFLNKEHAPEEVSATKAFAEHAAVGVAPGAAFMAAFPSGAKLGGRFGPIGAGVGGMISGTIASILASKAQTKVAETVAPEATAKLQQELVAGEEQHPIASIAGEVAAPGASAKVAPFKMAQLPLRAGLAATVAAVQPLVTQGRLPTVQDIIAGTLTGTLYGEGRGPFRGKAAPVEPPPIPPPTAEVSHPDALKDESGNVIVAQRGTADVNFDPQNIQYTDWGHSGPGIYFTTDPEVAKLYATAHRFLPFGRVLKATIISKKPYGAGIFTKEEAAIMNQALENNGYTPVKNLEGKSHKWLFDRKEEQASDTWDSVMKDAGYDSVRIPGADESELVVYDPKQIIWHQPESKPITPEAQATEQAPVAEITPPPVSVGPSGAGPGSPHVSEMEGISATALKNAASEMEAAGMGLELTPKGEVDPMIPRWIKSGQVMANDPLAGKRLADEMIADRNRALTPDDSALLLRHKVNLLNAINDAAERTHTGTKEQRAAAQAEHTRLSQEYNAFLDGIRARGTPLGQEMRWRQALARDDYTFESSDNMNRFHRARTGEDLTPDQMVEAERKAGPVKAANEAQVKANIEFTRYTRTRVPDAEKAALDAAWKTVREAAARRAEAENKARVAQAGRDKQVADIELKRAQKAEEAAQKVARNAAVEAAKQEAKNRADPSIPVWVKAKEYIEANQWAKNRIDSLAEMVQKIATDLGMPSQKVLELMGRDKRAKFLMDEAWRKQQESRRLRERARIWLTDIETPGYIKAIRAVPRAMFSLKVGLHGTVALGTHAPTLAFQPKFWKLYATDFVKMYRMVFNRAYYEAQIQDLVRRKNYITGRRAKLGNDPFQYEEYQVPEIKDFLERTLGKTVAAKLDAVAYAGNRGYSILKILRQDMFDQAWDKLPKTAQTMEMAEKMSEGINHSTGYMQTKAPRGANVVLFAPTLAGSRVAWLAVDPIKAANTFANWKNATPGERAFAINQVKEKAWVAGTLFSLLAINQGMLKAIGSNQEVNFDDPFRSDWLKFKVAGMNVSYGNAMVTMARLPVQMWRIRDRDTGKLRNLIHPDEDTYSLLGKYVRSQLSPFAGLMAALWLKADYQNRPLPSSNAPVPKRLRAQGVEPYSWPEFWAEQVAMIPVQEAIKEVWQTGMGMTPEQVKQMSKAMATIAVMTATGARVTDDTESQ